MNNYNPTTTPPGWTCPNCGQYVSNGAFHTCPSLVYGSSQNVYSTSVYERIANALERIASALEKLNK